jgi:glycine/D-amino acid oxidase-like deaminating enzyme
MNTDGNTDKVVVIGGGVSGLTTALVLLRNGIPRVEVWTDARGMAPPNWIWEYPPYNVEPRESAMRWARESLPEFIELALREEDSGVHLIRIIDVAEETCRTHEGSEVLSEHFPYNTGKSAIDEAYELLWADDMRRDEVKYTDAVVYTAPVCNSAKYLKWLQSQIESLGGVFKRVATITKLEDTVNAADSSIAAFVNCLGMGAMEALPDDSMYGCQGQLLHVDAPWIKAAFFADASDVYMIPCPGTPLELGGSASDGVVNRQPDQKELDRILSDNIGEVPSLARAEIGDPWVGVRPKRKAGVRLESERTTGAGRLMIHNYGHGGSGMCCSYGCANDVLETLKGVLVDGAPRSGL